jgi:Cip1-like, core domain
MRISVPGAIAACVLGGGCDDTAGAAHDAASPDATSADSGADSTSQASLCARTGLLFCEDFEALQLGNATNATSSAWDVDAANGELTIDAEHARGQRALKLTTTGNGRARLMVSGLAPPNNSLFGVVHAWVTTFPTAPDYAHFTMVELAGTGDGSLLRPIGGQYIPGNPAGSFWGIGSDGGPTGDWTDWQRTAPTSIGRWMCLEFQMSAPESAIDVWIDGIAKPELSVSKANHGGMQVDLVFPALERAWFGWWLYQANPTPAAFEVWLDDIALGDHRLGCD